MGRADLIIVGGGAAGLMAANVLLANRGTPLVLEGNPKLGKKLLATGNGRCNLTNLRIAPEFYHGDPLSWEVLQNFPADRVLSIFEGLGLLARSDGEGRIYPRGNQAASVLTALSRGVSQYRVSAPVESIRPPRGPHDLFQLTAGGGTYSAPKVLLACGGMAAPSQSMGDAGYILARSLGHTVTQLSPSLVPLKTSSKVCHSLKGMRVRARASLLQAGRELCAESGEVIFGDGRLSGICVLNLSSHIRGASLSSVSVSLDLFEELPLPELTAYLHTLREDHPSWPVQNLFSGALNLRVGEMLVKELCFTRDAPLSSLSDSSLARAARLGKAWRFPITGTGAWADAQVTAGGVPLSEVDLATMESRRCPGLYLAGELLDVDGVCGGYNLHWAWATGMLAGTAASQTAGKGRGKCSV